MNSVPVVDLTPWFSGEADGRARVAAQVDAALREIGFLLVTGHGVPAELREDVRAAARRFFALPAEVKQRYAAVVGERGWLPPGVEANGYAEGTPTPPDLKETFAVGADRPIGVPEIDAEWFLANVWPSEVPELQALLTRYLAEMRSLAGELLVICAAALGIEEDFFASRADHPSYTMNINRYPPLSQVGEPEPGQFRIGPHTDFGTVTVLDRQRGVGGLQVYTLDGEWIDAPFVPDSFTINIGDLLARWTGDRWRSTRHRVLPPDPSAPDEELISLIYFYECNPLAEVESLGPPVGRVSYEPVRASDYLLEKLRAITV
ncbi:isopenicillin N synthase family oxygenase [Microbispora hainanensis]|jgi:isopenicillin N synthase-like dioxygenase|uniref:Isopenicillin N synthase family oxygenase n=1 Tax=Microbispora hainanensis TaxID=568844 RepID=A0ABZ1SQS1_9ACTN|nr:MULTISPECIES: 2-oxoglutarate and iron-dependent oxygenase domain-containing protein [Microbispora]NJP27450.1 isopenicillin N synthase family oxygenase [Microbispora sp. CL1-1]TQS10991.1 isopenicillin N synthase family oxygenase [Microbispora sp. SCL1-1]